MNTSWGSVAGWYDDLLKDQDTFQHKVILPNLLRAMNIKKGETVADIACGNGFFSEQFRLKGARVIGTDISPELIAAARRQVPRITAARLQMPPIPAAKKNNSDIAFFVSPADDSAKLVTGFAKAAREISAKNPADKAVCVLAIQNIENVKELLEGCQQILASGGSLYIVMNHPAYRIPRGSSWGFDEASGQQYRRIDGYLSEIKIDIVMNPGEKKQQKTISFHRPLQYYFKLLQAAGFSVTRLEEWISHRRSQAGPRQKEEDRVRTEFPLFLFLEARRM